LNLKIAGLGLSKAAIIGGPVAGLEAACEGAAIGAIFCCCDGCISLSGKSRVWGWATSNFSKPLVSEAA
jgi:hypothetical protein